jgi:hypothetical protein
VQTIPNTTPYRPSEEVSLYGTMINEYFFGSSFAILDGMSKMMKSVFQKLESLRVTVQTIHEIKDTRSVQVLLSDQTDIELKGIAIYYDFNRIMGRSKNKIDNAPLPFEIKPIAEKSNNRVEEIARIQTMLEKKLITEEEYLELKKDILKKN